MAFLDFIPLIGGAVGAISSAIGGSSQNKANLQAVRETNNANMELAKYQADRNLDLWNLNNEYNTPAAQMQRYLDAGLNPNLIYGNGSSSAGNSSSPASGFDAPRVSAPKVDNSYIPNAAQLFMQGLSQTAQIRKTNAETAMVYQNIENLQKDNALKDLDIIYRNYRNSKTKEEAAVWQELLRSRIMNIDSSTVINEANARLADSNRFTVDALKPYKVAELKERVDNIAEDTLVKKNSNRFQPYRIKLANAQIANYMADIELKNQQKSESEIRTEVKRILVENGINLEQDKFDRFFYQLKNDLDFNWVSMSNEALGNLPIPKIGLSKKL